MEDATFETPNSSAKTIYGTNPMPASKFRSSRGQVLLEFAIVLPLLLLTVLGVIDVSYFLYDQHIITRLTREGSNLISRDVTISDAATAMTSMVNPPVNLSSGNSRLIFTVLTKCGSGANYDYVIVYQRYQVGSLAASSTFTTQGPISSAFGPAPDYIALNPSSNTNLRVTNVPSSLSISRGQFVYVTEIYSRHGLITPFNNFGISLPSTLYSIAYF